MKQLSRFSKTSPFSRSQTRPFAFNSSRRQSARFQTSPGRHSRESRPRSGFGCCLLSTLLAGLILITGLYLMAPIRHNVLLLGMDFADLTNAVARTDTMILATFLPSKPYVGTLSIPRDLWVTIPEVGENRINTAHFFAEANQPGSGPAAALQTVNLNFGVQFDYYIRIRFEGFRAVVNAMGGVDIELNEAMGGYEPGKYHLTGNKALAFVRYRQDSDDFFRMEHGQFMMKAIFRNLLESHNWPHIPEVLTAFRDNVSTNLPRWLWPRLVFSLLRVGPDGIDNRIIGREMVIPFVTFDGAYVLAPNWESINPVLSSMFGK